MCTRGPIHIPGKCPPIQVTARDRKAREEAVLDARRNRLGLAPCFRDGKRRKPEAEARYRASLSEVGRFPLGLGDVIAEPMCGVVSRIDWISGVVHIKEWDGAKEETPVPMREIVLA